MKLNPDDLHIHPTKQHKDCDWYDHKEYECTNWGEFWEDTEPAFVYDHKEYECTNWGEFWEDTEPAFVECFAPIGSIFKEAKK